jgi:cell wall-associated NlpC family hydrolase
MNYGICSQTMVPLRETPSDKSQMVNQLLFGDLFLVKENLDNWLLIETIDDNYEAWADIKQVSLIEQSKFEEYKQSQRAYSLKDSILTKFDDATKNLRYTLGSSLPLYNSGDFSLGGINFQHSDAIQVPKNGLGIIDLARKYINAPYLWGGRSLFGIDCSGFTQIVFKMYGIMLPRDSSEQINMGDALNFIEEANEGDLAFFENEEGKIIHVGILIDSQTIIHASGKVRIDSIDHNGIFNQETKSYSHKLRLIKRLELN